MTKPRFSKKNTITQIAGLMEDIAKGNNFDLNNGRAQVAGKSEEIKRAYGAIEGLECLAQRLEIDDEVNGEISPDCFGTNH